jgi:acyl carrier protein phosphodiesterase
MMAKAQVANMIANVENGVANASSKKDALDDALGDLNRSTNRLRRKFDPTDKWMETKAQVEKVVDDGRKINQVRLLCTQS